MKNARPPKNEKTSAPKQGNVKPYASFSGTDNPRHLRVIQALLTRPMPREHVDSVAGCSNGPELIAELRRRGLELPCTRTKKKDRDLFDCFSGVYHATQADRRKLNVWKRTRTQKGQV
ncbi:hypothetical protein ACVBEH_18500 [Roseateles sp. GG27B]